MSSFEIVSFMFLDNILTLLVSHITSSIVKCLSEQKSNLQNNDNNVSSSGRGYTAVS